MLRQKIGTAQRKAIQSELQRRDIVNRVQNEKTGILERLDRLGGTQLGQARAEAIKAELQRRKENPQAAPAAKPATPAAKQQTAQAAKGTFLEPKKSYDFSAEDRKPGWVDVGGGAQGQVRLNRAAQEPAAMKNGKVGQYEAAALEKLRNVSQVPNLYGVRYNSKESPETVEPGLGGTLGPHVRERGGKLAMELKDGKPIERYLGWGVPARGAEANAAGDLLIQARKAIHMRDVAHNDMHGVNVLYDNTRKKVNLIDFGLAQVNPKAALVEALGGANGRDWQGASMLVKGDGPGIRRYYQNAKAVEKKLEAMGVNVNKPLGIRTPLEEINAYFGKMTDSQARALVAELYDGV